MQIPDRVEDRAMMEFEIQCLLQVREQFPENKHIVQIVDHFQTAEYQCIVLEFSKNADLYEMLTQTRDATQRPFTLQQVRSFTAGLVKALDMALQAQHHPLRS